MAASTYYSGDDMDIEVIYPSQRKMTKSQQTGNRPLAVGTWCTDFGPKAETKLYLKQERQMGKNLITASTQQTDSSLIAMSQ